MTQQKLSYLHQHPVWAGTGYRAEEYVYSFVSFYAELEAVLAVERLF